MKSHKEIHAANMRDMRAKANEKKIANNMSRNSLYVPKSKSQGTLLTLHSYMFHVFCFTSTKVIIFNTETV